MKKVFLAILVAVVLPVSVLIYVAIPDAKPAVKHSAAYQRVNKLLSSLQKGDYKTACEVLSWYSVNKFVTDVQCEGFMEQQFGHTKMIYKLIGDTRGAKKYAVVTALTAQDNLATKQNESAICAKAWADDKDCAYAGVYSFGTFLSPSVSDSASGVKKPKLHWYVAWID